MTIGARRALLAEMDRINRAVLAAHLRAEGYSVRAVTGLQEALRVAQESAFQLAVCDLEIPGMDGLELRRRLARGAGRDVPIVFLTERVDRPRESFVLRDAPLLLKPVPRAHLRSALEYLDSRESRRMKRDGPTLSGSLLDYSVSDLARFMDRYGLSGRASFAQGNLSASIQFSAGQPADAQHAATRGVDALFRLLGWTDGTFAVDLSDSRSDRTIHRPLLELLVEGLNRAEQWTVARVRLPLDGEAWRVRRDEIAERCADDEQLPVLAAIAEPDPTLETVLGSGAFDRSDALSRFADAVEAGDVRLHPVVPPEPEPEPRADQPHEERSAATEAPSPGPATAEPATTPDEAPPRAEVSSSPPRYVTVEDRPAIAAERRARAEAPAEGDEEASASRSSTAGSADVAPPESLQLVGEGATVEAPRDAHPGPAPASTPLEAGADETDIETATLVDEVPFEALPDEGAFADPMDEAAGAGIRMVEPPRLDEEPARDEDLVLEVADTVVEPADRGGSIRLFDGPSTPFDYQPARTDAASAPDLHDAGEGGPGLPVPEAGAASGAGTSKPLRAHEAAQEDALHDQPSSVMAPEAPALAKRGEDATDVAEAVPAARMPRARVTRGVLDMSDFEASEASLDSPELQEATNPSRPPPEAGWLADAEETTAAGHDGGEGSPKDASYGPNGAGGRTFSSSSATSDVVSSVPSAPAPSSHAATEDEEDEREEAERIARIAHLAALAREQETGRREQEEAARREAEREETLLREAEREDAARRAESDRREREEAARRVENDRRVEATRQEMARLARLSEPTPSEHEPPAWHEQDAGSDATPQADDHRSPSWMSDQAPLPWESAPTGSPFFDEEPEPQATEAQVAATDEPVRPVTEDTPPPAQAPASAARHEAPDETPRPRSPSLELVWEPPMAELADEDEPTTQESTEESVPSIDALVARAHGSRTEEPNREEPVSAISSDVVQADFFHGQKPAAAQVAVPEPIWNLEPEEAAAASYSKEDRRRRTATIVAGAVAAIAAFAFVMWLVAQLQTSSGPGRDEVALPPSAPRAPSGDLRQEAPKRPLLPKPAVAAQASSKALDAQALYVAGRLSEAESAYRALAAANPTDEIAHVNLASVLIDRGLPDEARAVLEAFVKERPDSAAAQLSLAVLLHQRGELDRAKSAYQRFLEEAPEGHPQVAKVRNILTSF